jgi:hypothetical protein
MSVCVGVFSMYRCQSRSACDGHVVYGWRPIHFRFTFNAWTGMDANVSMRTDFVYVGEATGVTTHTPANGERAVALLEFLAGRHLRLVNTFGDPEGGIHTRRHWNGTCSTQIVFWRLV